MWRCEWLGSNRIGYLLGLTEMNREYKTHLAIPQSSFRTVMITVNIVLTPKCCYNIALFIEY